jgi:hypothetical protein
MFAKLKRWFREFHKKRKERKEIYERTYLLMYFGMVNAGNNPSVAQKEAKIHAQITADNYDK